MRIVLNEFQIQEALVNYIKENLGMEKDISYVEIISDKPIKKDYTIEQQQIELTVFMEVK